MNTPTAMLDALSDGFYHLYHPSEETPVLIYCYVNPDTGERGFGFNISDGGGFLPLWDFSGLDIPGRVVPVDIVERSGEANG